MKRDVSQAYGLPDLFLLTDDGRKSVIPYTRLTNDTETIGDILSEHPTASCFHLSDPVCHVGAGFSFDLALSSLDFSFGQSLSEKVDENHQKKKNENLLSDINSWRNIPKSGLSGL